MLPPVNFNEDQQGIHEEKNYQYRECEPQATIKVELAQQQLQIHERQNYISKECNSQFTYKGSLGRHQ